MPKVKFGEKWFQYDSLKTCNSISVKSPQEKVALEFCKLWVNGHNLFSFKTSGSTGIPKKISFTRTQLEASAKLTIHALGLNNSDVALLCLPVENIAGAMMIVRCILANIDLIITNPSSNPFLKVEEKVSFIAMTPHQLNVTLEIEPNKISELKVALIGGAEIPTQMIKRLESFSTTFYSTFGMTETLSHIALRKLNGTESQEYYHLLDGINVGIDSRNCLTINAPHIQNEMIETNDIVELCENGFQWLGRHDRVLNSGGVTILAEELESKIEDIFSQLNIHNRFFITGLPSKNLGTEVALVVEGEAFGKNIEQKITTKCQNQLGKYQRPRSYLYLPKFIETNTQKVSRLDTEKLLAK